MARVYLSGAITGTDDAKERFRLFENLLSEQGWDVVNPQKVCESISHWDYETLMQICFRLIDECEAVYFMPGWKGSFGANREYGYALGKDKIIIS